MKKGLILILSTALIIAGCKKEKNASVTDASLYSTWESSQNEAPKGITRIMLKIKEDGTFEENLISFGIYDRHSLNDTSGWAKSKGKVVVDGEKLKFIAHEYRVFDTGIDNVPKGPFVNRDTFILYPNGKFKITGNNLDFYYTSSGTGGYLKRTYVKKN